jgi:hypothetical protein
MEMGIFAVPAHVGTARVGRAMRVRNEKINEFETEFNAIQALFIIFWTARRRPVSSPSRR